ncbi:hypothetical protein AB0O07_26975 [Streptomyces sp. NPDC093085]|uniref:hypothetical protein n=1 Tax=Streptomyces sp. NPDC093085 TaxID=3155068 RepID=UPI003422C147
MMFHLQLHDVTLEPEYTLGTPTSSGSAPGPLHGRLTFGWDLLPADHPSAPPEWRAHRAAMPDREFRHLLMVCSFRPAPNGQESDEGSGEGPGEGSGEGSGAHAGTFRHAALGVALTTEDPARRPVARLIDPGERTRPVTAAGAGTGVSFTVATGVVDVGVERPAGAGPAREEWIVRGHGASQPTPQWEFRPVKRFPLVGDHPVAALVELVPGQVNTAEVRIAAELEHRAWGLRRYRARLTRTPHAIVLA